MKEAKEIIDFMHSKGIDTPIVLDNGLLMYDETKNEY